jgi:hypothetical protein
MIERAYTVSEIDRMRIAISEFLWRRKSMRWSCNGPDPARVEDQLRTYLIAGVSPEALEEAADLAEYNKDVMGNRSDWKGMAW